MLLPIRGSHDRGDCCARWRPQHCNDAGVLGLGPRWRLRRREHRLLAGFSIGGTDLFDRMRMLVQAIDEELQAARPGAATIATELATALFVMMLRMHFEQS